MARIAPIDGCAPTTTPIAARSKVEIVIEAATARDAPISRVGATALMA